MNKRNKKQNIKYLSSKDKTFYRMFFTLYFSLILVFLLFYKKLVMSLNFSNNYLFIEPTLSSSIIYYLSIALSFIYMISLYNKTYASKLSLIEFKKIIFKRKTILYILIVLLISVFATINSVLNVSFIDENGKYVSNNYSFTYSDIDYVEISVDESLFSLPRQVTYKKYFLVCTVYIDDKNYVFYSDYFYSYIDLYDYLLFIDKKKIKMLDSNFDDLIEHEKRRLFGNEKEIEALVSIMGLQS